MGNPALKYSTSSVPSGFQGVNVEDVTKKKEEGMIPSSLYLDLHLYLLLIGEM